MGIRKFVSIAEIKEIIGYNPDNGLFFYLIDRGNIKAGSVPGRITPKGYHEIRINGNTYQAGRLAWLLTKGDWPTEIDHINGNRLDNRFENLRECSRHQNLCNRGMQKNNKTGFKGVSYGKDGGIRARIKVNRKEINLGVFATVEDASNAYIEANSKYHGEFGRVA